MASIEKFYNNIENKYDLDNYVKFNDKVLFATWTKAIINLRFAIKEPVPYWEVYYEYELRNNKDTEMNAQILVGEFVDLEEYDEKTTISKIAGMDPFAFTEFFNENLVHIENLKHY